jgi:hypothetical protein
VLASLGARTDPGVPKELDRWIGRLKNPGYLVDWRDALRHRGAAVHNIFDQLTPPQQEIVNQLGREEAPLTDQLSRLFRRELTVCEGLLKDYAAAVFDALRAVAATLPQPTPGEPCAPAYFVGASELQKGDLCRADRGKRRRASLRHKELVECAVERAGDALFRLALATEKRQTVFVGVLSRGDFQNHDLHDLVTTVVPTFAGRWNSRVQMRRGGVPEYDERVGGAYVFADFFANAVGHEIDSQAPLATVEQTLTATLGVPLRSGVETYARSHLAASRAAREIVSDRPLSEDERRERLPPRDTVRGWAYDQAWEWAATD